MTIKKTINSASDVDNNCRVTSIKHLGTCDPHRIMPEHAPLSMSGQSDSIASSQQERSRAFEPSDLATANDEVPLRLNPGFTQRTTVLEILNARQPPSCDACRTRKLGCSGRPSSIEITTEGLAASPCNVSHPASFWDVFCLINGMTLPYINSTVANGIWNVRTHTSANAGDVRTRQLNS